jgi:hypothetical protein
MNFEPNTYAKIISGPHKEKTVMIRSFEPDTEIYYAQIDKKRVGFTKTQLEFLAPQKLPF